jgi:hypothetical protein
MAYNMGPEGMVSKRKDLGYRSELSNCWVTCYLCDRVDNLVLPVEDRILVSLFWEGG